MSESEVEKLKEQLAELEQQLAEEREEFEWDIKAAKEAAAASSRKLEEQLAAAQKASPGGGGGSSDEALTQRALMAERKVAELQRELERARSAPQTTSAPSDSPLMRQRAESAEEERDGLLREKRSLERQLEEKTRALGRAEDKSSNLADLRRQLDESKRKLMDKEKELNSARKQAAAGEENDAEMARLGAELAQAREALDEKEEYLNHSQSRVRELVEQLDELQAVGSELDEIRQKLAGEADLVSQREQEVAQLKNAVSASDEAGQAALDRRKETERLLSEAQEELARTKIASGQMVEQREREAERLREDLARVEQSVKAAEERAAENDRNSSRLEQELTLVRQERDQAVESLRSARERESTQVSSPPEGQAQAGDPFDEQTQRVKESEVGAGDPFAERTQAEKAPAGAVVPPEAVSGTAQDKNAEFPEPSGPIVTAEYDEPAAQVLDQEVALQGQAQEEDSQVRDQASFSKGNTLLGEPPMPEHEVLEPVAELESIDEDDLDQVEVAAPENETLRVDLLDGQVAAELTDQPKPEVDFMVTPDEGAADPADDLGAQWVDDMPPGEGDQSADPAHVGELVAAPPPDLDSDVPPVADGPAGQSLIDTETTVPKGGVEPVVERTAEVRSLKSGAKSSKAPQGKGSSRGLLIGLGLFGAAGLLIVGAWFFFPIWFGTAGHEPDSGVGAPDTPALGMSEEPVAQTADGGPGEVDGTAVAAGDDDSDGDVASQGADGSVEADGAVQPDASQGDEKLEPEPVQRSARELRAINKARAHGSRLIVKRRHVKAIKHLKGWVKKVPDDAGLRVLYGRALFARKKVKAAQEQMERATQLDGQMAEAFYQLGGIYMKLKKKNEAKKALQTFLELAPRDKRARAVRRNLKRMK